MPDAFVQDGKCQLRWHRAQSSQRCCTTSTAFGCSALSDSSIFDSIVELLPFEFYLWEHECSKIPTISAEIRTTPYAMCSLLTIVSRGRFQSVGNTSAQEDHFNNGKPPADKQADGTLTMHMILVIGGPPSGNTK
jgi:hypothetical protein